MWWKALREKVSAYIANIRFIMKGGESFVATYMLYALNIADAEQAFSSVPRRYKKGVRRQLEILGMPELEHMTLEELKARKAEAEKGEE
ncbi:hypothetical protein [Abiotrophia defectiva]|uniref:hypothetical protein n=1 Tax=Abiotrophia defectiva TaxID=46125 RepID=UPI0028D80037|nr:hypothetical protein [Abiotrophia defectiva]